MPLKDDDIVTTRTTSRRSFLAQAGSVLLGSAAIVAGSSPAISQRPRPRDTSDLIPADRKLKDIDRKNSTDKDVKSGDYNR